MDLSSGSSPAHRRRGAELENALLDAAWDELFDKGYANFTFEAVAERAGTSRPVLNRRWKSRVDLVVAAVKHNSEKTRVELPDTGTLRGDVIELLVRANDTRLQAAAVITIQLGGYFQETGTAPGDLREQMLGNRITGTDILMRRAMERGEIPTREYSPRVVSLPFDLARNQMIMNLKPLSRELITEIVDEIFLPLVNLPAASR